MALLVEIHFVGMFTFVQDAGVTYAVMPPTHHHGGGQHRIPEHAARLFFGIPPRPDQEGPLPESIPIERSILRITDRSYKGVPAELPTNLLDVSTLAGGAPVSPDALGAAPAASLAHARVDLRLDGELQARGGATYVVTDASGTERQVTVGTFTIWEEVVRHDRLAIELVRIDGDGTPEVIDLARFTASPADAEHDQPVRLAVYHVPLDEMPPRIPPKLERDTPVTHFEAYYDMLVDARERPKVRFQAWVRGGFGGETGSCPNTIGRR